MEKHKHLSDKLSEFVVGRYGADANEKLQIRLAKLAKDKPKNLEKDWMNIVADTAAKQLGIDNETLLTELGFSYIARMLDVEERFSAHLHTLGSNFVEFVNNIDYIHSFIGHKTKSELHLPSLRCEDGIAGSMELLYIAPNCCHSPHLIQGMVKAISNLVFQAPIACQQRLSGPVKLSAEKSDYTETTFDLNLQAIQQSLDPEEMPTMLAYTPKNVEKKISQSNVEAVNESIAKILETEGPDGHPLRRAARKKARLRWKKLADVTRGAAFFRFLASQFQPIIPAEVKISARDFCALLPYHVVINRDSTILHAGLMIQRQIPALKNFGNPISQALKTVYPTDVDLTFESIVSLKNTTFILSGEFYKKDRLSCFKGHFIQLEQPRRLVFIGSPYVRNVEECIRAGLKISQICEYDVTREFIFMGGWDTERADRRDDSRRYAATSRSEQGSRYGSSGGGGQGGGGAVVVHSQALPPVSEDCSDPQKLREQLANTRAQLEALKAKYKKLYLSMVPSSVMADLRDKARLGLISHETPRNVELSPIDDADSNQSHGAGKEGADADGASSNNSGSGSNGDRPVIRVTHADGRNGSAKRDIDLEKGLSNGVSANSGGPGGSSGLSSGDKGGDDTPEQRILKSISVDRGRLLLMQQERAGQRTPAYQPNYVEYDGVCMMFCDVVQFTQQNNMEKALKDLNQAYRWLVRLCQVFHLDIVESVGDAFLVISDVSRTSKNQSARNMADCALVFLSLNEQEFPSIQLRIGIHIGTIYGGIIERHQKMFLVWGKDLEFACKMESFGVPGKIQISQQYFAYINDGSFNFEEREKVIVRGKGPATYILLTSSKVWSKQDMENIFFKGLTM